MSEFTYEKNDTYENLERFEWDNVWFEHTEIKDKKRIYYIGDSISCQTRRIATQVSCEELLFDGFGTSKAIDHPLFLESCAHFAKQMRRMDAIIINNGLHGWHLKECDYGTHYERVIAGLKALYPNVPIFIVLTTHLADEARANRVVERNREAVKVAKEYELKVIDLYTVSIENKHLLSPDGVHFTADGYKLFAEKIVNDLKENGI